MPTAWNPAPSRPTPGNWGRAGVQAAGVASDDVGQVRLWDDEPWRLSAVPAGPIPGFAHLEPRRHIPHVSAGARGPWRMRPAQPAIRCSLLTARAARTTPRADTGGAPAASASRR